MIITKKTDKNNGTGHPFAILEIGDDIFIHGQAYDKYSLQPRAFDYMGINTCVTEYNTSNHKSILLDKTCSLYHGANSYLYYSARISDYGGFLIDSMNQDIAYIVTNKLYSNGTCYLYILNMKERRIIKIISMGENIVKIAGQDDEYVYLFSLNGYSTSYCGGGYVYNKSTQELSKQLSNITGYTCPLSITSSSKASGYRFFNDRAKPIELIYTECVNQTSGSPNPTIKMIHQIAVNGRFENREFGKEYANSTSPDSSITDFNKANFHFISYTDKTVYSNSELLIPMFTERESDLSFDGNIVSSFPRVVKFSSFKKDHSENQYKFYKEYPVNFSEYYESNIEFGSFYDRMISDLHAHYLQAHIEYKTIDGKRYMIWVVENTSYDRSNNNKNCCIMVFEIGVDMITLKSFTQGIQGVPWNGHLMSNDMEIVYIGTYDYGIHTYVLNKEKLKYELVTFDQIQGLIELGIDRNDNVYYITNEANSKRYSTFDLMVKEVRFEGDIKNFDINKVNTTNVIINTKNLRGGEITEPVVIRLYGNATFENGKKIIKVNGGINKKIPVIIKGTGKFDVEID